MATSRRRRRQFIVFFLTVTIGIALAVAFAPEFRSEWFVLVAIGVLAIALLTAVFARVRAPGSPGK